MKYISLLACVIGFSLGASIATAQSFDIVSFEDLNSNPSRFASGSILNITNDIISNGDMNKFSAQSLTIQGAGGQKYKLDGNGYKGFLLTSNAVENEFNFKNLTVTGYAQAIEFGKGTLNIDNVDFVTNKLSGTSSTDARGTVLNISNSEQNVYINNSLFKDNELTSTGDAMGGAVFTNSKIFEIKNTRFENNTSVSSNGGVFGGAIFADGPQGPPKDGYVFSIDNSVFKDNTAKGTYLAAGGAIQSQYYEKFIVNNSTFENNSAIHDGTGGAGAGGGALSISDVDKTVIQNSSFVNNSVSGPILAEGGAIDCDGDLTIINSDFKNNRVDSAGTAIGGAISNFGTTTLVADGKDMIFEGNKANNVSNAIYNEGSELNLNASDSGRLVFHDSITSDANSQLNINNPNLSQPSGGTIYLNNDMSGFLGDVNIYGGTVKLGENGTFFTGAGNVTVEDSFVLDMQNGKIQTSALGNLIMNNTANVKIDADWQADDFDRFTVNSVSGSGKIKITDINMINDTSANNQLTGNLITGATTAVSELDSSLSTILTSAYRYDVTLNDNVLDIKKGVYTEGLAGAVGINGERQYQMSSDENVSNWTSGSDMQGSKMIIKGNGNSVTGNNNESLNIAQNQNLVIDKVGNWRNFASDNGGAIYNDKGNITINDSVMSANNASSKGGALYNNNGIINIFAQTTDTVFTSNKAGGVSNAIHTNGGTLNFNASSNNSIVFNDRITSEGNSVININNPAANPNISSSGTVVLNENMSGYTGDLNLYHGTIKVGQNGTFFNPNNFNIYGCTLDFANNNIQHYSLGNLSISGSVDMKLDADLLGSKMDTISANNRISDSGKINVTNINLISDSLKNSTSLAFADENLKGAVVYSGDNVSYSPMFKYNVIYDENTGRFGFNRMGGGSGYRSFNPALFAAPVAAQLGGYLSQLNSYDQAFMNIGMRMLLPRELRESLRNQNKYAYSGNGPMVFSPLYSQEQRRGVWFRPYSSFENVPLKNGPKVSNVMYGSFMGVDSDFYDLGNGFEAQYTVYAGYNGSHQTFDGVSLYQNGGNLGFTGAVYKNNFFSALTANAGASSVDASTMFGNETFPMLMAGVASKTGYNWELFKGRFIIQPSYMMSYTFVNAFNYRNAANIDISSDPLNAIQISPGLKFIGNTKTGWQPYIGVNMVWNIMDKTKFKAVDTSLPELSVKPYVEYGLGVQKLWGDKFTGFAQAMLRSAGRNGIAFSLGFRWAFGKAPERTSNAVQTEIIKEKAKIDLKCQK